VEAWSRRGAGFGGGFREARLCPQLIQRWACRGFAARPSPAQLARVGLCGLGCSTGAVALGRRLRRNGVSFRARFFAGRG